MTDNLQPATSTDPVVPQTNPELTFDALIAMAQGIAGQKAKSPDEQRVATDNEVWPDVSGTRVESAPTSEGAGALLYTDADGNRVVVKADVNPALHDYLSKLQALNEHPESLEMIELQEKLHDASVLRSEEAPSLEQVRTIERDPSNPDVLMVYKHDDSVLVVTRELTPEAFETLDDMAKTLEGMKTSQEDGYERVDGNPFTDADIEGATIGVKDEVGPGLVRAEVFDADGGSRKVIVAKESNPQLYDRFVAVDEGRRNDDGKIDDARKDADLPTMSELDVGNLETNTADPNDPNRKLTVSEQTWQNLIAEWKTGVEDGSIGKDDDRAKLYNALRAQAASEGGLDMVVLDMSMGQNTAKVSGDDLSSIIDRVKVDERTAELFGAESVQKDFQAQQAKSLDALPDKTAVREKLEGMAFSEDYSRYIAELKKDGNDGLAEADISKTYAALAAFDPEKAAQFSQHMMIDATTMDLDKLLADPSGINDQNTVLATQDTVKTLLAALKKGGVDIPRRTVETERFVQEFLGNKQTAKTFSSALKELGATFSQNGTVTQADIEKVMAKDVYKTLGEGAQGSMLRTLSELNGNGVLGSAGGLISLASGIYQLAGKGGSLADTPEERLAIAKDMVSVLGAGQHFVNLGSNIVDSVRGTQVNQMLGLDKSLPQIFGKDQPQGGGRPFSVVEGDLKKLFEDFNAAVDAAPIDNKQKLAEKLDLSEDNMKTLTEGFRDGFAKNPGLNGSTPSTRAVSAFLRRGRPGRDHRGCRGFQPGRRRCADGCPGRLQRRPCAGRPVVVGRRRADRGADALPDRRGHQAQQPHGRPPRRPAGPVLRPLRTGPVDRRRRQALRIPRHLHVQLWPA
jgi:hypothetical protein